MKSVLSQVSPAANPEALSEGSCGRSGTALASRSDLIALMGQPHDSSEEGDGKVTTVWFLRTPRGLVCVRDYWWNREGEWSLAGSRKASLWAAAWLRAHALTAATGRHGYRLRQPNHHPA